MLITLLLRQMERQGLAQLSLLRVGVDVVVGVLGQRLRNGWVRPVGILVGVQLDDFGRRDAQPPTQHFKRLNRGVLFQVGQMWLSND